MQTNFSALGEAEMAANDLGPLAWVLDELRKSLDGATKALRRFVRDAELARGQDLAELDASQLRIARQQLHQAVGALEMVGLGAPAKLLRAMEALAQKFMQRPEQCSDDAAAKVERASFALTEYLEGVLKGRNASPVALFAQYRDVLELAGGERVHPADLWSIDWRWIDMPLAVTVAPLPYDPAVRGRLDQAVLKVVRGDTQAAHVMARICLGLAAAATTHLEARVFWKIAAAFFEALRLGLCPNDVYVKRAASRIIAQYTTLARGEPGVTDRLAQDLLFYCAQAMPPQSVAGPSQDRPQPLGGPGEARAGDQSSADAPTLVAVREAYGFAQGMPVDYSKPRFGRYDPAQLVLARKRIAGATETWAALAGGDTNRMKLATEQFAAVCDSMRKLHAESDELARALTRAMDATARSGEPPSAPVAMEVATAILYLEAAYDDLGPTADQMAERGARLAQRLDNTMSGAPSEPLEAWMEELYRRVSDRQTMGSVVDELRTTLGLVEKSLDQFFRNTNDRAPLSEVPSQLAQMRGVFSVLGLDQASVAALRMRDSVERFLIEPVTAAAVAEFERVGNSLGAMGFLIDMLNYQRALAKKLFVYDEEKGEFRPLMGREKTPAPAPTPVPAGASEITIVVPEPASVATVPEPIAEPTMVAVAMLSPTVVAPALDAPAAPVGAPVDDDDAEMREIFLEEAREVVRNGLGAIQSLRTAPADLGEQTTLRRAFHTLKGSSRMVGLNEFGEAAWALEQLLNTWLAEQKPVSQDVVELSEESMRLFGRWVEDIAVLAPTPWSAQPFRTAADALRQHDQRVALQAPEASGEPAAPPAELVPAALTPPPAEAAPELYAEDVAQPEFSATQVAPELADDVVAEEAPPSVLPEFEITQMVEAKALPGERAEPSPSLKAAAAAGPDELGVDLDFGFLPEAAPADADAAALASEDHGDLFSLTLPPFAAAEIAAEEPAIAAASPEQPLFDPAPEPPMASTDVAEPGSSFVLDALDALPFVQTGIPVAPDVPPAEVATDHDDDQVRVIGDLRIGIPLYNVYLNEADEWSRRLCTELSEWELELDKPMPDSPIALAHSLAGSSATVGFKALSDIARTLESALQHVQLHGQGVAEYARGFNVAADEIRRLLHQFAAGFLKSADPSVQAALQRILDTELTPVAAAPEAGQDEVSLSSLPPEPSADEEALAPVSFFAAPLVTDATPAAPLVGVVDDDAADAIDAVDALDADLFAIFEEEAADLFPQLGSAMRQWHARPDNTGARREVLRVLHTVKGSARLAGAMRLGEMAHRFETAVEMLGVENLQASQIEPLLARFDHMQSVFDGLRALSQEALRPVEQAVAVSAPHAGVSTAEASTAPPVTAPAVATIDRRSRGRGASALASAHQGTGHTVRVSSQLLDRLVNQAGEVIITRSRLDGRVGQLRASLKELSGDLERLRQQLREIEVQSESQMQSRMAQAKDHAQDFDPLEFDRFTRVQELTRIMAESVSDVATVHRNLQRTMEGTEDDLIAQARQARELQRDLLRTRMVEFEGVSERLYAVVRQAAKDVGKQVRLDIVGGSMDLDRGVLERMVPAFEHLLRNAVAHGIEDPETRIARGKSASGEITIRLHHEGNDVSVEFSDDGNGLDHQRIYDKAVANGLVAPGTLLSETETANLLFQPGFSTAEKVTELAGRGIGLDVVRAEVNALGGRIETSGVLGKGAAFKLVVPLTTAVTQVVMLRMGELAIGVPANVVEIVRRVPAAEVVQAYADGRVKHGEEQVPFFWSGALLQVSTESSEPMLKHAPVVVFRSAGQRVAMHVDEVLGSQEVVVKNLGPQLSRVPGLTGMSVLASGAVVLIYNPVALASVYGEQALRLIDAGRVDAATAAAPGAPKVAAVAAPSEVPLVLVVDDSITVRRVTQRLLKRGGYRVALANDGMQALERLQEEVPAVVLSDIEMPRMDGFDLARNIRGDERLKNLPIIMITSRIAEKHREHARELGVDHYLGKPYSEEELLGLISHYCVLASDAVSAR